MELVFVEKKNTVLIKQLITVFVFFFFKILNIDLTGNNVTLDEPIEVNWSWRSPSVPVVKEKLTSGFVSPQYL